MQWHQLDHMRTICTSLQADEHSNTSSLNFYRLDALSDANKQCQSTEGKWQTDNIVQIIEAHPNWPVYADVFEHPPPRLASRRPIRSDVTSVDN